jgi:hypothetical protein
VISMLFLYLKDASGPRDSRTVGALERIPRWWGRGIRRLDRGRSKRGPVGLTSMRVQAVLNGSPILPTPLAFRAPLHRLQHRLGWL